MVLKTAVSNILNHDNKTSPPLNVYGTECISNPPRDPIYDAETDEERSIVPFACVSADSVYDAETDDEGGNTNW